MDKKTLLAFVLIFFVLIMSNYLFKTDKTQEISNQEKIETQQKLNESPIENYSQEEKIIENQAEIKNSILTKKDTNSFSCV